MNRGSQGILLLAMGGPPRLEDVRPYLFNLFRDPSLFRVPMGSILQTPVALCLSAIRARKASPYYRQIGGGSPLGEITQRQAAALEKDLATRGYHFPVAVAMRYWNPDTMEAVEKMVEKNVDRIIALPMYPQYSRATTGSSLAMLKTVVQRARAHLEVRTIESWWDHSGYLACVARRIGEALDKIEWGSHTGILFLAHSLPQRFVQEGDPYVGQVEETVRGIMAFVTKECPGSTMPWYLAYQSRIGPIRWVGPSVEETLRTMVAQGHHEIAVVPVSFVSDHLETLYEIDIFYRKLAHRYGASAFVRIEALNDAPDFIRCLTDLILRTEAEKKL